MIPVVKAGDVIESTETIIKQGAFKQKNSLFSSWKVHSYMFDGNCVYRVKHHPSSGKVEVREVFPLNTNDNIERYDIVVTQIISSDDMTGKKNTIGFFFDENPNKNISRTPKIDDEHAAKIIEEMDEFLNEKQHPTTTAKSSSTIDKKKLSPRFLMATSAEEKKLWMNLLNQYLQKKPQVPTASDALNNPTSTQANAILSTIEAMIDIVIVSDAYGTITAYNTQAESFFGYKKKDIIGKDIKILMPFEVAKNHDEFMQRFRKTGNKHLIGKPRALPAKLSNGQVAEVRLSLGEIPGSTDRDKYRFMGVMRRQIQTPKTPSEPSTPQGSSPPSPFSSSQIPTNSNNRSGNRLMSPNSTSSSHAEADVIQQRLNVPYSVDEVKVSKSSEINQEIFEAHHHIYDLYKSIHGTLQKYGHSVNSSFKKDYSSLEKKFHILEEKMKHLEKSNSHMLANIHHQKKVIDFLELKTDTLYKERKEIKNREPELKTSSSSSALFNTPLQKTSGQKYKVPTDTTLLDVIKGGSQSDLAVLSPRTNNFMISLANLAGAEQSEFKDVLQNDYALKYFMKFASKELSLENVKLYIYLTRFYLPEAKVDLKKSKIMRQYVIDTFIIHGAPFEVNLSSVQRKKLLDKYYKLRDYEMEKEREEKQYMEDYIHRTSYPQHRKASTHSNGDEHDEDALSDGSDSEMEVLFLDNDSHHGGKCKSKNPSTSSTGSDDNSKSDPYGSNVTSEGSNSSSTGDNTEDDLATSHDMDEDGLEDMSFHEDHTFLKSNRRKSDSYLQSEISDQVNKTSPTLASLMYDLEEGEKFFDDLLIQVKGVMMDTYSRFLRSEEYKEMKEEVRRVHKSEMEIVKLKLNSTIEK
ncbi:predicted protein [Naegleria gruberi]|uniref:Predicted protein n=1 Tax=Naegleria gruberi TaxID=5762 RepID=D2VC34_NAEGR|nr:uncharacterized protein NAEGRDRAFT_79388 [Naegleria gruberi]EFC45677.1 predicted protein [Naegleria gruberi]|eukprot:XP_002678421.1 predicted protein [Naegleria gruberi strain NEG-M]